MKKIILLASLAFSINAFAQVPFNLPTNGLVAYYPFNGNANDVSGNGNNLIDNGGVSYTNDRIGNSNSSLLFDGAGTKYLSILSPVFPSGNSNRTFSVWYKNSQSLSGLSVFEQWVGLNGICDQSFSLLSDAGGSYLLTMCSDKYQGFANDSNWINMVIVYENSIVRFYKNGILISDPLNSYFNFSSTPLNTSLYEFRVGKNGVDNGAGWPTSFNGEIDDIAIWNRALTPTEVTTLYNTTITGLNPPSNHNTLKVFPNPANTQLTIDYGNFSSFSGIKLKIVNSIGQTVFTTLINQQSTYIDISTWKVSGIYNVQLIDTQNNTIENRKIVIQ